MGAWFWRRYLALRWRFGGRVVCIHPGCRRMIAAPYALRCRKHGALYE